MCTFDMRPCNYVTDVTRRMLQNIRHRLIACHDAEHLRSSPQPNFLLEVQAIFTLGFHVSFPGRVSRGAVQ